MTDGIQIVEVCFPAYHLDPVEEENPILFDSAPSGRKKGIHQNQNCSVFVLKTKQSHKLLLFQVHFNMKFTLATIATLASTCAAFTPSSFVQTTTVAHSAASDSALSMKYKVAVVGGGPSGACAAEIFAQEKGIQTVMFERKMDNVKPCGGDIPLSMVGEFNMPESVVDRKVKYILQLFCKLQIPCKWFEGHCKD